MSKHNGFTLTELIVAMVIIGVLAAIMIPGYNSMLQQGRIKAAENNVIAIYQAQQSYYFNNGTYFAYFGEGNINPAANTGGNLAALQNYNSVLKSNITDLNFGYMCNYYAPNLKCFAQTAPNGTFPWVTYQGTGLAPGTSAGVCYGTLQNFLNSTPGGGDCPSPNFPPI